MQDWIDEVEFLLMPAKNPEKEIEQKYQQAYKVWRSSWEKFRKEIGVHEPLFSDGFIGADEVGAIFYQGNCVALACFTYGNLSENSPLKDYSWFKGWNEFALHKLKTISPNIVIASQFTVGPDYTGKNQVTRWKEILSLYVLLRFENSIADVMAGHLNLTRKVNESCGEEFGATVLDPLYPFNYYGVELPAQLVAYEREKITKMKKTKDIDALCDALWSKLINFSSYPSTRKVIPLKKKA